MGRRRIADEREVLALFTAVMRGKTQDVLIRKSEEVVTVPPRLADRIHAAELLGKQLGLFGGKSGEEPSAGISPAELDALAEALRRENGG